MQDINPDWLRQADPRHSAKAFLLTYGESKYLDRANNLIEQDHRYIKQRVIASQNFRNFWSASRTIAGYESMNMIRKGQIQNVERDDILGQIRFIHSLFGIAV